METEGFKLSGTKSKAISAAIAAAVKEAMDSKPKELNDAITALAALKLPSAAVEGIKAELEAANLKAVAEAIVEIAKENKINLAVAGGKGRRGKGRKSGGGGVTASAADIAKVKAALGSKFEPITKIAEAAGVSSGIARAAAQQLHADGEADKQADVKGPWGNFKKATA